MVFLIRIVAAVSCVLLLSQEVAGATVIVGETDPFQRWTNKSRLPTPKGKISVVRDGSARTTGKRNIHFYEPGIDLENDPLARAEYLHEVGHVYSGTSLGKKRRALFKQIIGVDPKQKWGKGGSPLEEQFAQAYSYGALGQKQSNKQWYGYDYDPTKRQQKQVNMLIRGKTNKVSRQLNKQQARRSKHAYLRRGK